MNIDLKGGLVDGPVYANIFNSLRGVHLEREDMFAPYQNSVVVYHDDYHDYSSNEPTMDGTASMTYFLGKLAGKNNK
ncbi:MAG: glycoside hydrolase family 9 protein [Muribaculaceae bacterium]|nr:glycoside hydrolase family 9 protein [Muribaculaceae bacterium]